MGERARAERDRPVAAMLLVALVAALPFLNALHNGFVLDDELIEKDARIHQLDVGRILTTGYWDQLSTSGADVYRPAVILSYAVNYWVTGPNPASFHAVNVVFHVLTCLLLLGLLDVLFGMPRLGLAAALLFAAHPVHTEAVTGVVGRAEVQAAFFLLATLYLHARRYELRGLPAGGWLAVGLASFALALCSKETGVAAPALLLLSGCVDRGEARRAGLRRAGRVVVLQLAVLGAYLVARHAVLGTMTVNAGTTRGLLHGEPLGVRLATGLHVLAIYLRLLVWPLRLSADYSRPQVPLSHTLDGSGIVALTAAGLLAAVLWWALRRDERPLVFAVGFFVCTYAVIGNLIIPIGVLVAERLMYLPSVGFCCGVAWLGVRAVQRGETFLGAPWARRAAGLGLALVVTLYTLRTVVRNADWVDEETLYAATVVTSPNSAQAHYRLGTKLLPKPGRLDDARREFERTLALAPGHYAATVNMTSVLEKLGRPEEALPFLAVALEWHPGDARLLRLSARMQRLAAERAGP
jgi:hypothetical protein